MASLNDVDRAGAAEESKEQDREEKVQPPVWRQKSDFHCLNAALLWIAAVPNHVSGFLAG